MPPPGAVMIQVLRYFCKLLQMAENWNKWPKPVDLLSFKQNALAQYTYSDLGDIQN